MPNLELVTAADVQLMPGLAQRVTATRPDPVNSDASFGELAWNWGKGHASDGASWPRRQWVSAGDLVAWSGAQLPHQVRRSDRSVQDVTGAYLAYQVHPGAWHSRYRQPGFRFRTAAEAGPKAAVQAHLGAWSPSTYPAEGYEGVRHTAPYHSDLHILWGRPP